MDHLYPTHPPPRSRRSSLFSDTGDASARETRRELADHPQTARDRICVALIEDNCLVREALTTFLNRSPDIRVIGGNPEGHRTILRELEPDVVLLDLGLENGDSLRLAREVLKNFPDARVIVMDLRQGCEELSAFVTVGVSGFIMKDASLEVVMGTIQAVAAGLKVVPDQITGTLFSEIAREPVSPGRVVDPDPTRLTPREREVIALVAEGLSNKAISRRLLISIHTVKSHLRNVMDKLTLNSRLQLAKYVHEHEEARTQPPGAAAPPKDATPLAEPAAKPISGRTASEAGAPGRHSRPGERRAFGSRGRSRRRTRPTVPDPR